MNFDFLVLYENSGNTYRKYFPKMYPFVLKFEKTLEFVLKAQINVLKLLHVHTTMLIL